MQSVWAVLVVVLPLGMGWHFLRGGTIDHRFLLCFGLTFYGVLPFFAFGSGLYSGGPGEEIWGRSFEALYRHSAVALGFALVLVAAFCLGGRLPGPRHTLQVDHPLAPGLLGFALTVLAVLCAAYVWQARDLLGSGYLLDYRPDLMGPLATVNLVALLLLLNLLQWRHSRVLTWAAGSLLMVNSLALLSIGGRLYVAAPVVGIALLAFDTRRGRQPSTRLAGLFAAALLIGVFGLIGLLRVDMDIDWTTAAQLLLAEPLLTSISFGTLVDCPVVDWIAMPANYISSLINFIPSALLPDKETLFVELDPSGNCLASPFGATHIATALLVNFGWLGTVGVVMLFAYVMKVIQQRGGWWLSYTLCSLLPFVLFRDGFPIFNKAFFGTGLLLALVLAILSLSWKRALREARSLPLPTVP